MQKLKRYLTCVSDIKLFLNLFQLLRAHFIRIVVLIRSGYNKYCKAKALAVRYVVVNIHLLLKLNWTKYSNNDNYFKFNP